MSNSYKSGSSRMTGLSLVELMIAMALGLITVGAVGWVYLNTAQTYRLQDGAARMQEGARYAFEIISNDLRMLGATGCGSTTPGTNALNSNTNWYEDIFRQPLISTEKDGATGQVTQYSDALVVLRADIANEYIVSSYNSATAQFTLTAAHNLAPGALLVATDCNNVAAFQASAASGTTVNHGLAGTPGNATLNLGPAATYPYPTGTRLYSLSAVRYYVANNPAGNPSLYRQRPLGGSATITAEELVEGIEDLQVSYGVDTSTPANGTADFFDPDGDGDPYLRGDQVNSSATLGTTPEERWKRVVSVRISFLMRSTDNNVVPSAQTYSYNGASVTATDRRLRKVFTHVVKLRNRV
jgi:type IV pilus assembly protein PilW